MKRKKGCLREFRAGRWTLLSAFLVLLSWSLAAHTLKKGFYIEVPHLYQVKNFCGPAALAMVLRYWGSPVDQYELANGFRPFPKKGLSGTQLKDLAADKGFVAYSFSGSPGALRDHLSKGRPLIAALGFSGFLNQNHYVVLVGWDADSHEWIVHDPAKGPYRRFAADTFLQRWSKLDNWTLLVLPETRK